MAILTGTSWNLASCQLQYSAGFDRGDGGDDQGLTLTNCADFGTKNTSSPSHQTSQPSFNILNMLVVNFWQVFQTWSSLLTSACMISGVSGWKLRVISRRRFAYDRRMSWNRTWSSTPGRTDKCLYLASLGPFTQRIKKRFGPGGPALLPRDEGFPFCVLPRGLAFVVFVLEPGASVEPDNVLLLLLLLVPCLCVAVPWPWVVSLLAAAAVVVMVMVVVDCAWPFVAAAAAARLSSCSRCAAPPSRSSWTSLYIGLPHPCRLRLIKHSILPPETFLLQNNCVLWAAHYTTPDSNSKR